MGRPAAAIDEKGQPDKTSAWPKLAVSVRPSTRSLVQAIAMLERRPAWQIVEDSLRHYVKAMPAEDRKAIELLAARAKVRD